MIHAINIVVPVKRSNVYDEVALNKYPIIYIDDEDVDGIFDDEELQNALAKYIKNQVTHDSAKINIRTIYGDETIQNRSFKFKDKVSIYNI